MVSPNNAGAGCPLPYLTSDRYDSLSTNVDHPTHNPTPTAGSFTVVPPCHHFFMEERLFTLERPGRFEPAPSWQIDAKTREIGRRGLVMAREALRAARAAQAA